MPAPTPSWNLVRVYGTWRNVTDGSLKAGSYKVTIPARLTNSTDDDILPAGLFLSGNLQISVNTNPSLDILVPATDDPDIEQTGWQIQLTVTFIDGSTPESYSLDVPYANRPVTDGGNGLGVDLRTVALPATLPQTETVYKVGVAGGLAKLNSSGLVTNADGSTPSGGSGTVTSTGITDATTVGRNVLTAATQSAARSAIGAGTSNFSGAYSDLTGTPSVGLQPWQFKPETYGAVGDGQVASGVSTNGTNTFTSATIAADPAAVGKWVMINGARAINDAPGMGKITAVSGSNVTIDGNPFPITGTATGLVAVWATDDTAAFNSALDAAKTYAEAHNYNAELVLDAKVYGIAGLTQSTGPTYNASIKIPVPTNNHGRKLVISIRGAMRADHLQFWNSQIPDLAGTCLVSFQHAPFGTIDATYGQQSVIGGPSKSVTDIGAFVGFANTKVDITNLSIFCPAYTGLSALDLSWIGGCHVDGYSAHIFAPPTSGTGPLLQSLPGDSTFTNTLGCGARFPVCGNNDDVYVGSIASEGYRYGFMVNDHFTAQRVGVVYADRPIYIDTANGLSTENHMVSIQQLSVEASNTMVYAGGGGSCVVDIHMDAESIWINDLSDTTNALFGTVSWTINGTTRDPVVVGASNLNFVKAKAIAGFVPDYSNAVAGTVFRYTGLSTDARPDSRTDIFFDWITTDALEPSNALNGDVWLNASS